MRKSLMFMALITILAMPAIGGCGDMMQGRREVRLLEMTLECKNQELEACQAKIMKLPEEIKKNMNLTAELKKLRKEKRELEQRIKSEGK